MFQRNPGIQLGENWLRRPGSGKPAGGISGYRLLNPVWDREQLGPRKCTVFDRLFKRAARSRSGSKKPSFALTGCSSHTNGGALSIENASC